MCPIAVCPQSPALCSAPPGLVLCPSYEVLCSGGIGHWEAEQCLMLGHQRPCLKFPVLLGIIGRVCCDVNHPPTPRQTGQVSPEASPSVPPS